MAEWGAYNPATFTGFPESDLAVDPETRLQFALALYGIPQAFAALQKNEHFWAMSLPMRMVFGMMPMRYPHFYSAQLVSGTVQTINTPATSATAPAMATPAALAPVSPTPVASAPVCTTPVKSMPVNSPAVSSAPVASAPASTMPVLAPVLSSSVASLPIAPSVAASVMDVPAVGTVPESVPLAPCTPPPGITVLRSAMASAGRSSKRKRGNAFVSSVESRAGVSDDLPPDFEAASTAAPVAAAGASNKKTRVHFERTYGALKANRVRSQSVDTLGNPAEDESSISPTPKRKSKSRKILVRNARRRASSVFVETQGFPDSGTLSNNLREEVGKAKTWQAAFKMALRDIFSLEELRTYTAKYIDLARLKVATDLVREFCQLRGLPQPGNNQFHTTFSYVRRHAKPDN